MKMRRKKQHPVVQKRGGKGKGKEAVGKKGERTYARKKVVEVEDVDGDENEHDDGDGYSDGEDENGAVIGRGGRKTPALDGKAKDEMKRLADKFREVDEYTLEFEDMTGSGGSQMKDAR